MLHLHAYMGPDGGAGTIEPAALQKNYENATTIINLIAKTTTAKGLLEGSLPASKNEQGRLAKRAGGWCPLAERAGRVPCSDGELPPSILPNPTIAHP
jgi:hypothetical protein